MPCIGEERERVGENPGHQLDHHQSRDQAQRSEQEPTIALVVVRVHCYQANFGAGRRVYTA